jgi:hypothetical protein
MTPQQAAAKCREWAAYSRSRAIAHDNEMISYGHNEMISYGHGEREVAYSEAANLIDQIGKPQPWPPHKELQKYGVSVLAWMPTYGAWGLISWSHRGWTDDNYYLPEVSHYLPLPPAPEVQP